MSSGGDTFWKPPLLKHGTYDFWAREMETHVCSLDGQVWRVFEQGPFQILDRSDPPQPKKREDYDDADYKALEKNSRAIKVLLQALNDGDRTMALTYDNAKDMWEALKELYAGNTDVQRNRILAVTRDYDKIAQEKNESLEDFHARFKSVLGQLRLLGERVPEWKVTHQFLQALNPKWDAIAIAFQAQTDIKSITLETLVSRLTSNATIYQRKLERREPEVSTKSLALKVEKAFELAQSDEPPDVDDPSIALMTRAFRMAGKAGTPQRDRKEPVPFSCFRCGKKGHKIKDCRVKMDDSVQPKNIKKAMIAAWGASDDDSDAEAENEEACLMADNETNSPKVISKSTSNNHEQLTAALQAMVIKNEELIDEVDMLTECNKQWIERSDAFEEELDKEKESSEEKFKSLQKSIKMLEGQVKDLRREKDILSEQVDVLEVEKEELTKELADTRSQKIDDTSVEKISFLRKSVRTLENQVRDWEVRNLTQMEESDRLMAENEQLTKELIASRKEDEEKRLVWKQELVSDRIETIKMDFGNRFRESICLGDENTNRMNLFTDPRTHKGNCSTGTQLKMKEVSLQEHPFSSNNEPAYRIWKKQAESSKLPSIDLVSKAKNKSVPPGLSKYVYLKDHIICWYCGKAGHYLSQCKVKKDLLEKMTKDRSGKGTSSQDKIPSSSHSRKDKWRSRSPRDRHCSGSPRRKPTHYHKNSPNNYPKVSRGHKDEVGYRGGYVPKEQPRRTPRRKIDRTNTTLSIIHSNTYVINPVPKPSKPKLFWVRKN